MAEDCRDRPRKKRGDFSSAIAGEGLTIPDDDDGHDSAETQGQSGKDGLSQRLTQLYTLSYLVFFAVAGTLARLGLTALTRYANTPVLFTAVWANFGGSVVFGFLAEDRMLFREEWGAATYDGILARARERKVAGSGSGSGHTVADLAAAKKAHLACKKTIPLYIGLTTGFCGSFTSFSAFIRDVFLAVSNDLVAPGAGTGAGAGAGAGGVEARNGGYSVMAGAAVVVTTVVLSLGGLVFGAHCAAAAGRVMPSLPCRVARRVVDPLFVVLGWGCWAGAVAMAIVPPRDAWRGQVLFALVFAPLGCLARFYLALLLNGRSPNFPLGTLAANLAGTAVLGTAWDLAHARGGAAGGVLGCQVLQGVEDGFCGCLTTVSTWVAEMNGLRRRSAYVYGCTSVLACFAVMVVIMGGLRWTDGWSDLLC